MKPFSIVVAVDEKNGIGKQGDLPWRLAADLKHFKEITTSTTDPAKKNAVIMGRKTWDSLPPKFKPLPGRLNIVLSRGTSVQLETGIFMFSSLDAALQSLDLKKEIEKIFVIGGAQVYAQAILHPACQNLFMTHVKGDFSCEVFFPAIPTSFKKVKESLRSSESDIQYFFVQYQKT